MQVLDDEINQIELFDSWESVREKCFYCKVECPLVILRCEICLKWFCCIDTPEKSHLSWHLISRGHKKWTLHPENPAIFGVLKCVVCFEDNLCNLCIYNNKKILCRKCCIERNTDNRPGRTVEIMTDGQVSELILAHPNEELKIQTLNVNKKEAFKIEKRIRAGILPSNCEDFEEPTKKGLKKAQLQYNSSVRYFLIFKDILLEDMEYNRKNTGDVYSVNLFKKSNNDEFYFNYSHLRISQKFRTGGYIELLKNDEHACNAVICSSDTDEKTVFIKLQKNRINIIDNEEFQIKIQFLSVPYERMINGLKILGRKEMDHRILKSILGNLSIKNNQAGIQYLRYTEDYALTPPNFKPLNESQLNALKKALTSNLSIIQGPPGTGKTQTSACIVWNIKKILLQQGQINSKILVSSSSNMAVDNLVERIHKTGLKVLKVASKLREKIKNNSEIVEKNSLHTRLNQYFHKNHPNMTDLFSCIFEYDEVVEFEKLNELMKVVEPAIKNILRDVDVIVCTNIVAGDKRLKDFDFPYVLIDEANQSTEPESILPLLNGCKNLVLLGDQMQLGPVTLCSETKHAGLCTSLMSRLMILGLTPTVLNIQYRMNPHISEFPSKFFYENQLLDGVSDIDRPILNNFWPNNIPTIILHNAYNEASSGNISVCNTNEAYQVLEVINKMIENFIDSNKIVVLTPYEAQKDLILSIFHKNHLRVNVLNIDEFQGSEQDYVVFSTVRSNPKFNIGFLSDFRRMNVAITRARLGMVMLGDCFTLLNSTLWRHIVKYYYDRKLIFEGNFGRLKLWSAEIREFEEYDFGLTFKYFL